MIPDVTRHRPVRNPWVGFAVSFLAVGVLYIWHGLADHQSNHVWAGLLTLVVALICGVGAARRRRSQRTTQPR